MFSPETKLHGIKCECGGFQMCNYLLCHIVSAILDTVGITLMGL